MARPSRAERQGRRRAARLAAVQALYQVEVNAVETESLILEFLQHRNGAAMTGDGELASDPLLFQDIVRGTLRRGREIDRRIAAHLSPGWPLPRLEKVLLAILRCAVYELLVRADIPARVVIDEYVEIVHGFFDGGEPGFANAVLDKIAHGLRPEEFAEDGRPARPAP